MIREVSIDNKQIDVEDDNVQGYIFESPIFKDITKILANRTTVFNIPKTQRNLNIFGLCDNPDVYTEFPYRKHTIKEERDGMLFIKGNCSLVQSTDENLQLSVSWGNSINLLKFRDLKLRDLQSTETILWNEDSTFLLSSDPGQKGFIVVDFGKGISIENVQPSVTIDYILKLIESDTGVHFIYPDRFINVFTKTWIPLIESNPDINTWRDKYSAELLVSGFSSNVGGEKSYFKFSLISGNPALIEQSSGSGSDPFTWIQGKEGAIVELFGTFYLKMPAGLENPELYKVRIFNSEYFDEYFDVYASAGNYVSEIKLDISFTANDNNLLPVNARLVKDGNYTSLDGCEIVGIVNNLSLRVRYEEVQFGDIYPIVPNLPDMTVPEFLKSIMQLYGIFTYYNYKLDDSTIEFFSIDDIYAKKSEAYNWTDRLITTNQGRFNLTYMYSDYTQVNNFKYKQDKGVRTKADGFIQIDDKTILKEKDLVELPFSPSDNTFDDNNNTYAKVNLFGGDGQKQDISYRILNETKYRTNDGTGTELKAAVFDDYLKMGGDKGLLATYYSAFQYILMRPLIAKCYVYIDEPHRFRELTPVYIDGVYYAQIKVTIDTNNLAVCELIRMPAGYKPPVE